MLAVHYPLIAASRQFQAHYWSPAAWGQIPDFYITYLLPILFLSLLPLGSILIFRPNSPVGNGPRPSFAAHERAAIYALSLMPVGVIVGAMHTTHAFVDRYVLWAVIGLATLAGFVICDAARGRAAVGTVMLCGTVAALVSVEAGRLGTAPALLEGQAVMEALESLPDSREPIVIDDLHVFMELSYYAQPRLRARLVYPVNRNLDLRYLNCDTGALLMSALMHRTDLHIRNYAAVLDGSPPFLLAVGPHDYLLRHFRSLGYRVIPVDRGTPHLVFEVSH